MADTMTVRSKLKPAADGGNPVALWEVDAEHPKGEVFVAGPEPVEVAKTSGVMGALRDGRIEEVKSEAAKPAK